MKTGGSQYAHAGLAERLVQSSTAPASRVLTVVLVWGCHKMVLKIPQIAQSMFRLF